jgi:hypothetical protein
MNGLLTDLSFECDIVQTPLHTAALPSSIHIGSGCIDAVAWFKRRLCAQDRLDEIEALAACCKETESPPAIVQSVLTDLVRREFVIREHGNILLASANTPSKSSSCPSFVISGASGPCATKVNGVFDATEELSCDQFVYIKRDDPEICLHFWKPSGQWLVAAISNKGKNATSWAYLKHIGGLDSASSLNSWSVTSHGKFGKQPDVRVRADRDFCIPPAAVAAIQSAARSVSHVCLSCFH